MFFLRTLVPSTDEHLYPHRQTRSPQSTKFRKKISCSWVKHSLAFTSNNIKKKRKHAYQWRGSKTITSHRRSSSGQKKAFSMTRERQPIPRRQDLPVPSSRTNYTQRNTVSKTRGQHNRHCWYHNKPCNTSQRTPDTILIIINQKEIQHRIQDRDRRNDQRVSISGTPQIKRDAQIRNIKHLDRRSYQHHDTCQTHILTEADSWRRTPFDITQRVGNKQLTPSNSWGRKRKTQCGRTLCNTFPFRQHERTKHESIRRMFKDMLITVNR